MKAIIEKRTILGLAAILSVGVFAANQTNAQSLGLAPKTRRPALAKHTFKLTTGKSVTLPLKDGKVTVLDFWGTWCAPCKEAIPMFERLAKKYGDKIAVYGMNAGETETDDLEKFLKARPIAYDIAPLQDDFAIKLKVSVFPTTIVLDKNGKVAFRSMGLSGDDEQVLDKTISTLLKEPAAKPSKKAKK